MGGHVRLGTEPARDDISLLSGHTGVMEGGQYEARGSQGVHLALIGGGNGGGGGIIAHG